MMKNRRRLLASAIPTLYLPLLSTGENSVQPIASTSELTSTSQKKESFLGLSNYTPPDKKHLLRRIIELSGKVKQKNIQLKNLREKSRYMRKRIASLKNVLAELEKGKLLNSSDADLLRRIGVTTSELEQFPRSPSPRSARDHSQHLHAGDSDAEPLASSRSSNKIKENADADGGQIQEGYYCNVCSAAVHGFRYICVQCADFDLCGDCEARGEHGAHYVLRVPGKRPSDEITSVLEKIRRELFEDDSDSDSIKIEIKEEPSAEADPLEEDLEPRGSDTASVQEQTSCTESNSPGTVTVIGESQTPASSAGPRKRRRAKSRGGTTSAETSSKVPCERAGPSLKEFWENANIIKVEDREVGFEVFVHREAVSLQSQAATAAPASAAGGVRPPQPGPAPAPRYPPLGHVPPPASAPRSPSPVAPS